MGASTFFEFADGRDVDAAFRTARDRAAYAHGHGGYTGTMAEKRDYTVIQAEPVPYPDAAKLAEELIDADDVRISDKWGPAGAIRVKGGMRRVFVPRSYAVDARGLPATPDDFKIMCSPNEEELEYDGWLFFGWASA